MRGQYSSLENVMAKCQNDFFFFFLSLLFTFGGVYRTPTYFAEAESLDEPASLLFLPRFGFAPSAYSWILNCHLSGEGGCPGDGIALISSINSTAEFLSNRLA